MLIFIKSIIRSGEKWGNISLKFWLLLMVMKTIKSKEIIAYIFVLAIAFIPFFQIQSLADPSLLSRQIYIGFLLLLGLILFGRYITQFSFSLPKPLIFLCLTWLSSAVLGVFYANNLPELWYTSSKVALYISAIWLLYIIIQSGQITIKHLSIGIGIAAMSACILLILEIIEKQEAGTRLWEQKNLYAIQSVFGHKNLYASFQLLCLPFILYFFQSKQLVIKSLSIGLIILLLLSIALIQTKSVILGLIMSVLLIIPMASTYLWKEQKGKFKLAMLAYVILLLTACLLVYLKQEKFTLLLNNDTIKERLLLWNNTLSMIQAYFPFGVGAGNWQIYFPKYGLQSFMQTNYLVSDGYTTFQRPHSDFLWVLSELGILGFAAYVGLFMYVLKRGIKQLQYKTIVEEKVFILGLLITLIAYVFVAMVDFPLERNEHQFILAILFCILIGLDQQKKDSVSKPNYLVVIVLPILIASSLSYGLVRMNHEKHSKKIIEAHALANWNKLLKEASKINKNVYSIDNYSIPIAWYQGLAQYALNNPSLAKQYFTEAYHVNPYQVHVLNNMAGMQEQEGNHDAAIKFYDELLSISPTQPDAILNKSAVLYNQKKYTLAMDCLYAFKFDESNTQYIQFLQAIGYAYLKQEIEKNTASSNQAALQSISDPKFVVFYFTWNQAKGHTFNELIWPQ